MKSAMQHTLEKLQAQATAIHSALEVLLNEEQDYLDSLPDESTKRDETEEILGGIEDTCSAAEQLIEAFNDLL